MQNQYPIFNTQGFSPLYPTDINLQNYRKKHVFINNFPRAKSYNKPEDIVRTFPHLMHVNNYKGLALLKKMRRAKVFILKSNNDDDIHKVLFPKNN